MSRTLPLSFGTLLRRYRLAVGLTQEELAERSSLSANAISALERGARRAPRKETILLLAEALTLSGPDLAALEAAARQQKTLTPPTHVSAEGLMPLLAAPNSALPPFIGRARELALLERHFAGSGPPILFLTGEPGIGKTRLLQEAAWRAENSGWSVVQGGRRLRGGQEPYAPILVALERALAQFAPAERRQALEGCAWLARLLPELAEMDVAPAPAWALPPEQERRLMFAAVGRFLTNIAGPSGTLLALDDLQWAGADALDLLASLLRSAAEIPLRIVGAYRSTEVRRYDPLNAFLADLAADGLVTQIALDSLTPQEAGELLNSLLEDQASDAARLAKQVLRRASGVPFFLVSYARDAQVGALDQASLEAIPWDVAQSTRQRLAALPETARELLALAAVIGDGMPARLMVALAAQPEQDVLAALEIACQAGLLEETSGESYHLAHDLIREVVLADLSAARRKSLHRRVAETLEQEPGDPSIEQLAYQYSRAGEPEKAILYLELAGDRARAVYAAAEAEAYYRELIAHLESLHRLQESARVREKLGALLYDVARYDEAIEVLEEAAYTYRAADDLEGQRRAVAQIAHAHGRRGSADDGLARLSPLLNLAGPQQPSQGLAAIYTALASLTYVRGAFDEASSAADQAVALARAAQNQRVLLEALHWRTIIFQGQDHIGASISGLAEEIDVAEAVGDLWSLTYALNNLALMYVYWDQGIPEQAQATLERALQVAEQLADPKMLALIWCNAGKLAFLLGDWQDAQRNFQRAAPLSDQMSSYWRSALAGAMGALALAEGQWADAAARLEGAYSIAERINHRWMLWLAQSLLAERDLLDGRAADALARLTALQARSDQSQRDPAVFLPTLAWAALECGDETQASALLEESRAQARTQQNRLALVEARRVQGILATRQRRWPEAQQALEDALALAQPARWPYLEAKILYASGLLHQQQRQPDQARARLRAAQAIFTRLGERMYASHVEQSLAGLTGS